MLKTHAHNSKYCSQTAAEREVFQDLSPSVEEACLTHPHSFASPARTIESNLKSKSISWFRGVGQAGLAPPNLRYTAWPGLGLPGPAWGGLARPGGAWCGYAPPCALCTYVCSLLAFPRRDKRVGGCILYIYIYIYIYISNG